MLAAHRLANAAILGGLDQNDHRARERIRRRRERIAEAA
jgi:hypothetical protein